MAIQLKGIVKPTDFKVWGGFLGSNLQNREKETVVRNIVIISRENDNRWFDFTFARYKLCCAPRTDFGGEEAILDALVSEDKILDKNGDTYSVNERFFRALATFIT